MAPLSFDVCVESWPVAGTFTISRGSRREAVVIVVSLSDGIHQGRGECVPYPRYGETVECVAAAIKSALADGVPSRSELAVRLPAGAARNAVDCALIDLAAKRAGKSAAAILGLEVPTNPQLTCFTLSLASPDEMARQAVAAADKPLLKLKLGGAGDAERLRAVRAARLDARLVADANEAWDEKDLAPLLAVAAEAGVELIEQPLPAGRDGALARIARIVPVCADESLHPGADVRQLAGRYDAVNIKLDKAGGLTEAVQLATAATAAGLNVMVGCMLSTSLAMAPAFLLAGHARWLDLDGPLLLARDRDPGVCYERGHILPPPPALWG